MNKEFLVVNAFANGPFGGNPAAVFTNADGFDTETMQAYARQLNLVETVFVFSGEKDADFRLRYFTPNSEIPVAGHPSIATWIALLHKKIINVDRRSKYLQANLAGIQEIEFDCSNSDNPVVTVKQPLAKFLEAACSKEQVASVFSLSENDLSQDLPIGAVDTGLGHLIVALKSIDALFRVQRNIEPLRQLCQSVGVREAQLFCFETLNKTNDLHTRNLCPREGLEDPACGVGNGALAAYLSKYHWSDKSKFSVKIEQGDIVKMPSLIHTKASKEETNLDIFVGGTGAVMLEGNFLV